MIMNTETSERVDVAAGERSGGSKKAYWIGWVMSVLPSLMLLFSAAMKLAQPPPVLEGFKHLGWPERLAMRWGFWNWLARSFI